MVRWSTSRRWLLMVPVSEEGVFNLHNPKEVSVFAVDDAPPAAEEKKK